MIADAGDLRTLRGPAMNVVIFANLVTIADKHNGGFTTVFEILINFAYRGKLTDDIMAANMRVAINHRVRANHRPFTNHDISVNDAKCTNTNIGTKRRTWGNNRVACHNGSS